MSEEEDKAWMQRNRHLLSWGILKALGEPLTLAEQAELSAWYSIDRLGPLNERRP